MTQHKKNLAKAFNTWADRLKNNPENFMESIFDEHGNVIDNYGDLCAEYLTKILQEQSLEK